MKMDCYVRVGHVPFSDAASYAGYLADLDNSQGIKAVRAAWGKSLHDLYAPNDDKGQVGNAGISYPAPATFGDQGLECPQDGDSGLSDVDVPPAIHALDYNVPESGVDHSGLVTGLDKKAEALVPGDGNTGRRYNNTW